jgi:DNA-binding NarL/FixJ family response regulator
VKHHVHNVLEKLEVSRRSEAAARVRPEAVV